MDNVTTPGAGLSSETVVAGQALLDEIAWHLVEVEKLFKRGVKLTLIARRPGRDDGSQDVIVSNDDLDTALASLGRHRRLERIPDREGARHG